MHMIHLKNFQLLAEIHHMISPMETHISWYSMNYCTMESIWSMDLSTLNRFDSMDLTSLTIRFVIMRCTYKLMMSWMPLCSLRVLSVFYCHACQHLLNLTRADTLTWRVIMNGIQNLSTFLTSGKYLNYLKMTQGKSIRPNMILFTPTKSQHPTMSMIRIHIMNLILKKPYGRKFPPVLYNWRIFVLRKSMLQWQLIHKWNTTSNHETQPSLFL